MNQDKQDAGQPPFGLWLTKLNQRERDEVTFARLYARDFHHGTDGHTRLMLIATLADALDAMEEKTKWT